MAKWFKYCPIVDLVPRYLNHHPNTKLLVNGPAITLPQGVRRLNSTELDALAHDYRAGKTVYELAAKYRIKRQTVGAHLARMAVPMRRQGLTGAAVEEAAGLYRCGMTFKKIAERFSVSDSTVRTTLRRHGVAPRPRGAIKQVDKSFRHR